MSGMSKIVRGLAALTLPASAMFVGTADATHGGNVHCGDTITANTTLTGNVVDATTGGPCTSHGVVIGANSITLNLNGFKIIGDADTTGADAGVYNSTFDGVTVTDGTAVLNSTTGKWDSNNQITGFENGVQLVDGANSNIVERVNIVGNVGRNLNGEGVLIHNSDSNTIKGNTVVGNGPYAAITLLHDSDSNVIGVSGAGGGNVIAANAVTHQDIGIRLEQDVTPIPAGQTCASTPAPAAASTTDINVIRNNSITGSTIDGISALGGRCDATGNEIDGNNVFANGRDGIRLNNRVKGSNVHDNTVCENRGAGIRLTLNALDNDVTNNTVGYPAPCGPNDPANVDRPVANNPFQLLPPDADLHDGNVDCGVASSTPNVWTNHANKHLTEYAPPGSTPEPSPTTPPLPTDWECID